MQRALAGSGSWSFSIQLEGANLIAYSDSSVVFGTLYDYRVQACRSGYGCSAYAYLYNVKTASDTTPAGSAPTVDVKVNNVDGTISPVAPASYTVSWTTTESPTTCVPEGAWFGSGDKTVPSGSWQFSSVTVLGLKTYTLTCSNAYGYASDTVYVDVVSGTTDGGGGGGTSTNIPNAPSNLRLDPPSSTSAIYLKCSNGPTTRTTKTSSMCKERLPEAVRGLFRFSLKDQTLSHTQIHLLFPALSTTTEFRHVVRVTDVPRTLIFTM
ncbi:MAG: hypothetical protein UX23_C0003G0043 [Parcubacteria group bacterium GW2011_GWB1_45_9]|nr:MAG: hypothetical protein UX23_C0003G0043 [Parcubacteria group bacterium GW2011_GWB1_45_9]